MNQTRPLRSVAVFGGGIVALTAAAAFARALPRTTLTLITTPVDAAALADRLPTVWPSGAAMLARIGIDEAALVSASAANHRLANRFAAWGATGLPWLVPEGEPIAVAGRGALHHRWLDVPADPQRLPYHALFPATVLAAAERFALPLPPAFIQVDHTLRLDPERFAQMLARGLHQARVQTSTGVVDGVLRDNGSHIAAVRLTDGRTVTADLFIDATGPAALLQSGAPRIDWRSSLAADRLLVTADRNALPSLLDAYEATDLGWSARWSMPDGGIRAFAFAEGITSEARARRVLGAGRDTANLIACSPGRLLAGWTSNCLALGDAAVQPGPLGLAGLTLALAQLALALDLLPGRDMEPLLISEYNRRAALRADRLRDYIAAHYLPQRVAGPFWQALQGRSLPSGLAATVARFTSSGNIGRHEEESVTADQWRAVLIGQGLRPTQRDPISRANDAAAIAAQFRAAQAHLAAAAATLPTYRDWLVKVQR